jgi:hypothetical protein
VCLPDPLRFDLSFASTVEGAVKIRGILGVRAALVHSAIRHKAHLAHSRIRDLGGRRAVSDPASSMRSTPIFDSRRSVVCDSWNVVTGGTANGKHQR